MEKNYGRRSNDISGALALWFVVLTIVCLVSLTYGYVVVASIAYGFATGTILWNVWHRSKSG